MMTNDHITTQEHSKRTKNAFKLIFHKGTKNSKIIKRALNDLGCSYHPYLRAYVGSLEIKEHAMSLLMKHMIRFDVSEIYNPFPKQSTAINSLQNQIEFLQEKVHEDYMKILSAIEIFNKNKPPLEQIDRFDFEQPPNMESLPKEMSEERKQTTFAFMMEIYILIHTNREEEEKLANLRNSLRLHEAEEAVECKLLENLEKNEIGDAELFIERYQDKYIFDPSEGKNGGFYVWNGFQWELDVHKERYKDFDEVSSIYFAASENQNLPESSRRSLKMRSQQLRTAKRRINVFETISAALSFRGKWDNIPRILPCGNGYFNLLTGEFLVAHSSHHIRKICPTHYNPNATCPKFLNFLQEISLNDPEWMGFLKRSIGYAVVGVPTEEIVIYWYGEGGRNGKGTLAKLLQHVLGPLARTFPSEMLLLQKHTASSSSPSPELANLEGVRLAFFSEVNEGRNIDSAKVKNLSGRDKISCRRLFSNIDLQIEPSHTMIMQTNYKPRAPADDKALWARNILMPFKASFVRNLQQPHERPLKENLKEELQEESEGILLWIIEGCREYQANGLQIPQSVLDETEGYRKENDGIGRFLEERCDLVSEFSTPKGKMEKEIMNFCEVHGFTRPSRKEISNYLKERFKDHRIGSGRFWKGVKLSEEGGDL